MLIQPSLFSLSLALPQQNRSLICEPNDLPSYATVNQLNQKSDCALGDG